MVSAQAETFAYISGSSKQIQWNDNIECHHIEVDGWHISFKEDSTTAINAVKACYSDSKNNNPEIHDTPESPEVELPSIHSTVDTIPVVCAADACLLYTSDAADE